MWVYGTYHVPPFFLPLPAWLACGLLYIVFSRTLNRAIVYTLWKSSPASFALFALTATLVAPLLYFAGTLAEAPMKNILLAATITAWFIAAPLWMKGGQ